MENYELYKWFVQQGPVMQALYAGLFTWAPLVLVLTAGGIIYIVSICSPTL